MIEKKEILEGLEMYDLANHELRKAQDQMREAKGRLVETLVNGRMYHYLQPCNIGWLRRELSR